MKKLLALAAIGLVFGMDYGRTSVSDSNLGGNGLGLYLGYEFNDTISAEVGYRRLFDDGARVSAVQASVVGSVPLGQDFRVFGRLGYNRLDAKASGPRGSASADDSGALVGVGAEYAFNKSVAARLEVQKPASDTQTVLLGFKFSF